MPTTIELDDPQGVINSLQSRIAELEHQVVSERARGAVLFPAAIEDVVKHLRLHSVILLHVGESEFNNNKRRDVLSISPALHLAIDQVWQLHRAPLTLQVKDQIRIAANNGVNRW